MSKISIFDTVVYLNKSALKREILSISRSPLNEWDTWGVLSAIDRVEPADVTPVVHAQWTFDKEYTRFKCSNCGGGMVRNVFTYCPWCGARMDGEKE